MQNENINGQESPPSAMQTTHAKLITKRRPKGATKSVIHITKAGLELVREHAAMGRHQESIAAVMGMSRRTLLEIRKRQPEVDDALQEGRVAYFDKLVGKLNEHLALDDPETKANVTAMIFALKSMFGMEIGDARVPKHLTIVNDNRQQYVQIASPEKQDEYLRRHQIIDQARLVEDD